MLSVHSISRVLSREVRPFVITISDFAIFNFFERNFIRDWLALPSIGFSLRVIFM